MSGWFALDHVHMLGLGAPQVLRIHFVLVSLGIVARIIG